MGEPADGESKRPSGIPHGTSEKRRLTRSEGEVRSLRPPSKTDPPAERRDPTPRNALPPGLGQMTTSARRRLELAVEHDESEERDLDAEDSDESASTNAPIRAVPRAPKVPVGLKNMTTSARLRLELALEHDDEDVFDPKQPPRISRERLSQPGTIPFDATARQIISSLSRWIGFCGVITLGIGALTGLSYLTGEGSVAHVVVGILATAISVWQLMAVWSLRKVLSDRHQQHHMVHALGFIRSALLLKALLVCAAMVLGCFTFSIAGSLLFLLG